MAKFTVERIKYGYKGRQIEEHLSITAIQFEEGDEVVELPSSFEGEAITMFAIGQRIIEGHEEWCDWHHPGKGSDWVPDEYEYRYLDIDFPPYVKKLIIPSSVTNIAYTLGPCLEGLTVEVASDNIWYVAIDGVLCTKYNKKPLS